MSRQRIFFSNIIILWGKYKDMQYIIEGPRENIFENQPNWEGMKKKITLCFNLFMVESAVPPLKLIECRLLLLIQVRCLLKILNPSYKGLPFWVPWHQVPKEIFMMPTLSVYDFLSLVICIFYLFKMCKETIGQHYHVQRWSCF